MPARNTPAVSSSPFAVYAREHGYATLGDIPGGGVARYLSQKPTRVAPNSPALEELAKKMGVPLAELQEFAKAPPMEERWVKKIRKQIEAGTLPKGKTLGRAVKRAMAKRERAKPGRIVDPATVERAVRATGKKRGKYAATNPGNAKNPFTKLLLERGHSLSKLGEEINVKPSMMWKLSMGNGAPNHPVLIKIADATGASLGQLAATQHAPPMTAGWLAKAEKQFGVEHNGHQRPDRPGKAVVLGSIQQRVRAVPGANGKHREPPAPKAAMEASARGDKGPYNRLRGKSDLQLRQSVRALISTLNVSVMKGDTHMPPIPIPDMYAILRDYMSEKGIKAEVLLDPQFGSLFDPK